MKQLDRHLLVRDAHEQAVLTALVEHGPLTRAELVELTGLSRPTVSGVVSRFLRAGLLHPNGTRRGIGRSATLLEINPTAGVVAGVDLGGTKIRVAIAGLFGTIVREVVDRTDRRGGRHVVAQIGSLVRALVREADLSLPSVRRLTLGTPGIERPDGTIALAANIPGFDRVPVGRELESRLKVPVTVENDVNLAALGEQWQGVARGYEDFAYLAIGTGVGVGLVMGGELQRGWRGAAGEVGYLPIGTDRITPRVRRVGAFELAVAGPAIRRAMIDALPRYPQSLLSPRSSVADIFALAGQDDPLATHLLEREVELLTKGIVSIVAIADPALIVLGGGVGSNVTLLEPLRRAVRRATTSPVRLEVSTLGLRAPLLGAIEIGAAQARRELLASRTAGG